MQILGVTLIAVALVIPVITAHLTTDSFHRMMMTSTLIGALTGFWGMYLSFNVGVASGAAIVLLQASIFDLVSALVSRQKYAAHRLLYTIFDHHSFF